MFIYRNCSGLCDFEGIQNFYIIFFFLAWIIINSFLLFGVGAIYFLFLKSLMLTQAVIIC